MNAGTHWRHSLLGLLVALAGCQGNPKAFRYIEALNAERLALEDQVYALEYDLQTLDAELAAAQDENAELRRKLGGSQDEPSRRSFAPRRTAPARRPAGADEELRPPMIEGDTTDEPSPRKSPDQDQPGVNPPLELPGAEPPQGTRGSQPTARGPKIIPAAATLATNDRKVVRVAVDPGRTGGADFDGQPGHDGVTVVVQPKNAAGQVVVDAAALSVAVLDPNRVADQARVARWDLDVKQVAELADDPTGNRGLKLHFAWPDRPPASSLLRLYVRYTTADGERFDTEQEIHIELPQAPGWRAER